MADHMNIDNSAPSEIFFSGLNNPRGLKFDPEGFLYVAEAGKGGITIDTLNEDCEQVSAPVGPYTAGPNSACISRISSDGKQRTIVTKNLPSSQTSMKTGGNVSGVADIAFVNNILYALISGAGCSHGLKRTTNGIVRINGDGTINQIVDLSIFWRFHPTAVPDPNDIEPDGTPFCMIEAEGKLYVIEAHNAELDEITIDGKVTKVIDISETQGHIVPTTVVFHGGRFFVSNLHRSPVQVGAARIYEIFRDGKINVLTPRLTAVTGIAFDNRGQLYALESTSIAGPKRVPGSGRVVKVIPQTEDVEVVASGLSNPTAMVFGTDGMLYISNYGFGFPPDSGQIIRLNLS